VIADQREVLADKSIARLFSGEKQHKVRASELSVFFCARRKVAGRRSWLKAHAGVTAFANFTEQVTPRN
jgi:hypothetical protein